MENYFRNGALSGSLAGLGMATLQVVNSIDISTDWRLAPIIIWLAVGFCSGGLAGSLGGWVAKRLSTSWINDNGRLIGFFFGLFAYMILLGLAIGYAFEHPVFVP